MRYNVCYWFSNSCNILFVETYKDQPPHLTKLFKCFLPLIKNKTKNLGICKMASELDLPNGEFYFL